MWFTGQWGCWVETAQSRCGLTVQLYSLSHKYTPAHIHFELKMFLKKVLSCLELQAFPAIRAQRVGFGSGIEKKLGRFGSGKSVEIFDRVFPGTLFTLGYFQVFW